jgi:hypothetical protein
MLNNSIILSEENNHDLRSKILTGFFATAMIGFVWPGFPMESCEADSDAIGVGQTKIISSVWVCGCN